MSLGSRPNGFGYELFQVSEERDEEVAAFCHILDLWVITFCIFIHSVFRVHKKYHIIFYITIIYLKNILYIYKCVCTLLLGPFIPIYLSTFFTVLTRLRSAYPCNDYSKNAGFVWSPCVAQDELQQGLGVSIKVTVCSDHFREPLTFSCDGKNRKAFSNFIIEQYRSFKYSASALMSLVITVELYFLFHILNVLYGAIGSHRKGWRGSRPWVLLIALHWMGVLPAICFVYSIKRGSFSFTRLGGMHTNPLIHTERERERDRYGLVQWD